MSDGWKPRSAGPTDKERRTLTEEEASADPWGSTAVVGAPVSRYRILSPIGIGGMGVVYRAEDTRLGRPVALKFLPPLPAPNPRARERFLDEARAASALDHPNICTIYEVGETAGGQLYIAMACYDGETLKRRLERGPLSAAEALHVALQVARGLAKAHRRGIVHRDVKPANLMITADGIVKILDFGIAQTPERSPALPLLGTPAYMSPEQAAGGEVDPRGDVWSLGAVLREMLAVRTPAIDRVLSLMLAPDREDRYPDADALLPDLARLEREAAGLTDGRASRRSGWLLGLTLFLGAVAVARSLLEPWGQDLEIPSPDDPLDADSAKSPDPPVTRY
jgi:serine/threonine protein kinase